MESNMQTCTTGSQVNLPVKESESLPPGSRLRLKTIKNLAGQIRLAPPGEQQVAEWSQEIERLAELLLTQYAKQLSA